MLTQSAAARRPSTWRRLRSRQATPATSRYDSVTGLLLRDELLADGERFVQAAHAAGCGVAVVSVFVEGIDAPVSLYTEDERNHILATLSSEMLRHASDRDVVGRIGLAEIVWVTRIDSLAQERRRLQTIRLAADAALSADPVAADAEYRFSVAQANGRLVTFDDLVAEARAELPMATASAS